MLERRGQALFLNAKQNVPAVSAKCGGEMAHIHESDLSAHLLMSFADAKEVISKGYGERHRMSGSAVIPLGYTLVYVPRNLQELDVLMRIFEAAILFAMSSGEKA